MKTAKDLENLLKLKQSDKNTIIDTWLEKEVFPKFTHNKQGFSIPEGVSLSETEELLKVRGFLVKTYSDYQGSFVYLSIPPQGE
tara:strand:+ start:84702 stop:84953 length:252 start_codon:yes stop_codon:yes gene_type:complete